MTNAHQRSWLPTNEALLKRHATRGFLSTAPTRQDVEELLLLAGRAPSGSNIQPWKVRVVTGRAKLSLTAAIISELDAAGDQPPKADWHYYPVNWREPYLSRRRATGWGLYSLLQIGKGDREKAEAFRRRNYDFFGAPVGMIVTIDKDLEVGSWIDLGIFLGCLVTAAQGRGFDTCLQQSFADVHAVVRRELQIPDGEVVVCGVALGHADPGAPQNKLVTDRMKIGDFVQFYGFEPDTRSK